MRWSLRCALPVSALLMAAAVAQERPDRAQAVSETAAALAGAAEEKRDAAEREAAACKPGPRYVLVDATALRAEADPASELRAQLAVGNEVETACDQSDGWVRVWARSHSGLGGWMRADLLSVQRPTLETLQDDYRALPATDHAGRRRLAERALLLEPFDERSHRLRVDALRDAGDPEALAAAELALAQLLHPQVSRDAGEPRLIFAYDGQVLSPLATLDDNGLQDGPYTAGDDSLPVGDPRRAAAYFRSGRVYHYYRGGVSAGMLRVLSKTEPSCESDVALAQRVGDDAALGVGIAANFPLQPIATAPEPAPDAAERRLLERLLRDALRAKGLSRAKIDEVLTQARGSESPDLQLAAARLQAPGPRLLIATLRAYLTDDRDVDMGAHAMLIVEPDGKGGHRVAYRDVAYSPSGESSSSSRYLDYIDLDGDGRSELIFVGYGYESWRYQVWRRGDKEWTPVAAGGGGGC